MRRSVHQGEQGAGCVACVTLAEQRRMPWHASYIDVLSSGGYGIEEKHNAAIKRAQLRAKKAKGVDAK